MFYSDTKPAALPFERRAFKVYCCLPGLLSVLLVFVNQVLQFLESGSGLFEMFVIPQELGSNSFMAQRVEWSEVKRSAGGGGGRKEGSRRSLSGWALALDDCVWGEALTSPPCGYWLLAYLQCGNGGININIHNSSSSNSNKQNVHRQNMQLQQEIFARNATSSSARLAWVIFLLASLALGSWVSL